MEGGRGVGVDARGRDLGDGDILGHSQGRRQGAIVGDGQQGQKRGRDNGLELHCDDGILGVLVIVVMWISGPLLRVCCVSMMRLRRLEACDYSNDGSVRVRVRVPVRGGDGDGDVVNRLVYCVCRECGLIGYSVSRMQVSRS